MAKKLPVIKIKRGTADNICASLKIGKTTLYDALNSKSNSDEAKRTREVVLSKYGGVKTTRVVF